MKQDFIEKLKNDKNNLFISTIDNDINDDDILVSISDEYALKDIKLTAGSKMLEDFTPKYTASVVKTIIENGYKIIGKTNMDEFGITSHLSNPYFGANIDITDKNAYFSSSLAVKNDLVDIAILNDNSGVSRISANYLGLYGFKPTFGTTSRAGVIQTFNTFGQTAAISKDYNNIYNLFNKIAKKENSDLLSVENNEFKKDINSLDYKDMKIALINDVESLIKSKDIKDNYLTSIELLKDKGLNIESIDLDLENINLTTDILSNTEFSSNMNRYNGIIYGHRTEEYNNTTELFEKSRSEGFGLDIKERIVLGLSFINAENHDNIYEVARKNRNILWTLFDNLFKNYDLIITPVSPYNLEDFNNLNTLEELLYNDIFSSFANLYGAPSISIPINSGILATAGKLNDSKLIYLAKVLGE